MSSLLIPFVIDVFFVLAGLAFGSFSNVIIHRLPRGESIGGHSRCPQCERRLRALELIPVLSYVGLRGRCRGCSTVIAAIYPLVEIATGGLFLLALRLSGDMPVPGALLAGTFWLLLTIAIIDARTTSIPDALNLPLLVVAAASTLARNGAIDVAAPLILVAFFGIQWIVSKGKWVGSGDILLAAGVGLAVGDWQLALLSLGFSYVLGALVAVELMIIKKVKYGDQLPFGPFLALGAVMTLMFGEKMLRLMGV